MKWIAGAVILVSGVAKAQIKADHPYNGIGRPIVVDVHIPGGGHLTPQIELLEAVTAEVASKVDAIAGEMDLAKAFPELWATKRPRVLYAQLVVDGRKTGPALVLQPMTNPLVSRLAADGKTLEFVPDEDGPM